MRLLVLLAVVLVFRPHAREDLLEPSIENEVAAALARAEHLKLIDSAASDAFAKSYVTNAISASEMAIRLVSSQRADGRWLVGTNDVSAAAVRLLVHLSGLAAPTNLPRRTTVKVRK